MFPKSYNNQHYVLVLNKEENEELDIENMIDDFITFFFAGQDTTANTLAFTFLMLGKYPEVMEKY